MASSRRSIRRSTRLALGFGMLLVLLCGMAAPAGWELRSLVANTLADATDVAPSYRVEHDIGDGLSQSSAPTRTARRSAPTSTPGRRCSS